MRATFLSGLLLAGLASLRAQDDVAALLAEPTAWQSREVGDGVFLRHRHFAKLFTGPQSVTVLEMQPASPARFDLVAPGKRTRTSVMGREAGALAAINGGFFDIENTGLSTGLLRLDGALVVPAKAGQGSLGIAADGRLRLATRAAGDWPEVVDALGAGPMLLVDGKVLDHGPRQRERRHPRSAIGLAADGTVRWLAVDGRTDMAAGMTFEETARVLAALGCRDALNLDGGGSTTLWVAGLGVCNYPCDNKRYDHAGERAVANAVLLRAPAVVVVDDDEAELRGEGWRQRTGGDVHGADFATTAAAGAAAVFAAELPFPGRWRVAGRRPEAGASAPWTVDLAGTTLPAPVAVEPGGWRGLGDVVLARPGRAAVVLQAAAGAALVVDALRFVQVVE